MLKTETSISVFGTKVREGALARIITRNETFTCGAFMKNVTNESTNIFDSHKEKEVILGINKTMTNEEVLLYWIDKVKKLGVDAEYFGLENGKYQILYKVPQTDNSTTRLQYFTILRYGWAHPYISLVRKMMSIEKKYPMKLKKDGYWKTFMKNHCELSKDEHYSSTFGLTKARVSLPLSDKEFIAKFDINYSLSKFDSINTRFSKK